MGRRRKREGRCHLCGKDGPLTFEHVPPRKAFNDQKVIVWRGEDAFGLGPDGPLPKGQQQQRGSGAYTLCGKCNNDTGGWYGGRFVSWCHQAMEILLRAGGKPSLLHLHYLFPLAIIKQIATMFFSVNGPQFRDANEELVAFVLNRERKYLSPRYRFFVYYNLSQRARFAGVSGRLQIGTGKVDVMTEFTFPPFGYVLTFGGEAPDPRLFEITHFSRYDYQEFVVQTLAPAVLPVETAFPGDYRTAEEVRAQAERSHRSGT